jgi:putative transcriptional regulator
MSSLFEDLKEGLEEAIAYEKGYGAGRVKTYMILPVKEYSGKEIRDIRTKAGMTQSVFASYMGVSIKTVEAWEGGRTHPTGPVFRLLDILSKNEEMEYIVAKSDVKLYESAFCSISIFVLGYAQKYFLTILYPSSFSFRLRSYNILVFSICSTSKHIPKIIFRRYISSFDNSTKYANSKFTYLPFFGLIG